MEESKNENSLHHIEIGEGTPAILIHGIAASSHDWTALIPAMTEAGFHSYAVDLFGHGDSPKPDETDLYTASHEYEKLEAWIEDNQITQPLILVGHSFGGYLSLMYALNHPERVRAMVLISPLFRASQLVPILQVAHRLPYIGEKAMQWSSPKLIDKFLGWDPTDGVHFSPQTRLQIAIDYKRASHHIIQILPSLVDLSSSLQEIHTPSLVIWGDKDLTLKPSHYPELVSLLPNAKSHKLPGSGHQPHIGQPEIVNNLVLDFIGNHT
jgi:pimeloyl-ACP methyl ester carboxylesterase